MITNPTNEVQLVIRCNYNNGSLIADLCPQINPTNEVQLVIVAGDTFLMKKIEELNKEKILV